MTKTPAKRATTTTLSADQQAVLDGLIEQARQADTSFRLAMADAIDHAVTVGQAFRRMETERLVRHGQWAAIYRQCDISERQAERYRQLAQLVAANPSRRTEIAGLSIQAAIKALTPPKTADPDGTKPTAGKASRRSGQKTEKRQPGADFLDWLDQPVAVRRRIIQEHLGIDGWIAALPEEWQPIVVERLQKQFRKITLDHAGTDADGNRTYALAERGHSSPP